MSEQSQNDVSEMLEAYSTSGVAVASAAALLGADLIVVALAWDNPPSEGGIITITFLMMISFVAFINVLHHLMRMDEIVSNLRSKMKTGKVEEKDIRKLNRIGKWTQSIYTVALLFTMIAFWTISYKYLISLTGYHFAILILPFILFILYWVPVIMGVVGEISRFKTVTLTQLSIQIVFLVLICLDFFGLLRIP